MTAQPLHVLVIDDDADTRSNLADVLELDNYHVECAGTAAEALARDNWPQLAAILLDRKLPDSSAEELLPQLRQLAPQAAVLIVTGYADVQGAVAAIRQGAADYLLKPIDADELRARLGRIAEHRRTDMERQRQARMLRSVMDTINDAVMVVDEQGEVQLFNPAVERIIGPVFIGAGPDHWPQHGTACHEDGVTPYSPQELALARALRGEEIADAEELIRRPGKPPGPWVSASANPLRDESGALKGAVVVWRDISERKHDAERLLQTERLAAIGQMMTGLAHESGNALARSQSCLEMLSWEVEDRPAAMDLITRIQKAQDHLKQLYEEVRGYAAPLKLERDSCDLAGVWRQAWENLALARRGRDAALCEEKAGVDLRCNVDPFRLEQVFRNIFDNALAACRDPVRIVIRCAEMALGEPIAASRARRTSVLSVSIQDNGPGLNPEQRQRIFDPFFTTKTKGTGLGMAIAKRIIEAHGGRIAVGRAPGGAEICLSLPRDPS
jgi:signal transduction histidine kinase/FixJ family two-component response regulator